MESQRAPVVNERKTIRRENSHFPRRVRPPNSTNGFPASRPLRLHPKTRIWFVTRARDTRSPQAIELFKRRLRLLYRSSMERKSGIRRTRLPYDRHPERPNTSSYIIVSDYNRGRSGAIKGQASSFHTRRPHPVKSQTSPWSH